MPTPARGLGIGRVLLEQARTLDRDGDLENAIAGYQSAIGEAESHDDNATLAESLRLLAIALHRRSQDKEARQLIGRAHEIAQRAQPLLAAQALNTLAAFDLAAGAIDQARETFLAALRSGGADASLRGRIGQNLGIIANIEGDLDGAMEHYEEALDAFHAAGDLRGCAMVYSSLGLLNVDRRRWELADAMFRQSIEISRRLGDIELLGLALLSQTKVQVSQSYFDAALDNAEHALRLFDQVGVTLRHKADAYRVIGAVYRSTGRPILAEARLHGAIELAQKSGAVLEEAEAARELAQLYRDLGRNQDSLRLLNSSHRLFQRLHAQREMIDVATRLDELETSFLAIVHEWGQSIESSDAYTHGHCERVADVAVSVARVLGMDESQLTTIRLGAYLHDVGKIRVPHEILNKPGRLTDEEFAIMKRHPVDGLELLAGIEFPWDIKPMIRWHHEKYDGTGYPDGLVGDEIPMNAQIICVADVYDALTTTRSYRGAMTKERAVQIITESHTWWRPDVYDAFMRTIAAEDS